VNEQVLRTGKAKAEHQQPSCAQKLMELSAENYGFGEFTIKTDFASGRVSILALRFSPLFFSLFISGLWSWASLPFSAFLRIAKFIGCPVTGHANYIPD
jgi:hypothetical protein